MATSALSDRDILRRRLAGQFLINAAPASAAGVVRTLGAVQAQDYTGAKWAVGQRMRGTPSDAMVEREVAEGAILRTHVMRPTWHFVAPEDIRWMLALTAPRVNAAMAYYDRTLELTPRVFARSNNVIARSLEGGKHLTRTELGKALGRARIAASGQRLGHLMMRAELDAVVCSGARRGKQFTYALLDERVPPSQPKQRDEALHDLAQRYFATRGPATAHDFAWWSGLTVADANRAIQTLTLDPGPWTKEGRRLWFVERTLPRTSLTAHLLPNYDEYFIGYKDRGAIGGRLGSADLVTGGDALIAHVIFVNGELVGGWKRVESKGRVSVTLRLIARLTAAERARVDAVARRYSAFWK